MSAAPGSRHGTNLAVCGRFHFHNYVRFLADWGVLNRYYYSHRIGGKPLPSGEAKAINLWQKEYLMRACGGLFGYEVVGRVLPVLHDLWQGGVFRAWAPAEIWHVLLHGTALGILKKAKGEGSHVLGEPVNAHPLGLSELMAEEAERLGLPSRHGLGKSEERRLEELALTDRLVVASLWLKRSFVHWGYPEERIGIIPYGVNLSRFTPGTDEMPPRPFRVLSVAQISPRKGHIDLLRAWNMIRLPDAELVLIGALDESMRPVLKEFHGQYRHIPFVPNVDLPHYYRGASVFVLPSIEDGFSVACMEALGCGIPVITTEQNGAADVIVSGRNGYVVPIRSPGKLAELLERLYRDHNLCRSMGAEAARIARESLGWEVHARRIVDLYRELVGPSPGLPGFSGAKDATLRS